MCAVPVKHAPSSNLGMFHIVLRKHVVHEGNTCVVVHLHILSLKKKNSVMQSVLRDSLSLWCCTLKTLDYLFCFSDYSPFSAIIPSIFYWVVLENIHYPPSPGRVYFFSLTLPRLDFPFQRASCYSPHPQEFP